MREIRRLTNSHTWWWIIVIFMSISLSAFGHDPLKAEDEHDDRVQHDDHVDLAHARELIVSFRKTGDDRFLDLAWAQLEPTIESASVKSEALVVASFVAQSRHEFEVAVDLINRALAITPYNDEGWLSLAAIKLVTGDADSAAHACRQLRNVPALVLLTCQARVALARGDHQIALERLSDVILISDSRSIPADVLAWSYSVAGDLAVAASQPRAAEDYYKRSLQHADRTQVRAALVDVLLDETRFSDASSLLDDGTHALPLLVRRLIVAKKMNRINQFQDVLSRVEQEFDEWIAEEDWLHAREMARFYVDVLDRPDMARRLALINLGLQREPEDRRLEHRTRPAISGRSSIESLARESTLKESVLNYRK